MDADNGKLSLTLENIYEKSPTGFKLAQKYTFLGIEHILIGIDHLAFVLGLYLIASGWRLFKLITAFTVGHSISLFVSSLGWIAIPIPPTEAVIALSVAVIAREALVSKEMHRHGYLLVMIFGLLHGLGFASVLDDIGVSSGNLLVSIFSFNLGVEIGQLLFIMVLILNSFLIKQLNFLNIERATQLTAMTLGSVAIFWTFERVSGFI